MTQIPAYLLSSGHLRNAQQKAVIRKPACTLLSCSSVVNPPLLFSPKYSHMEIEHIAHPWSSAGVKADI